MSKKKFELTKDMVDINSHNLQSADSSTNHNGKSERITITIAVDKAFRSEFKAWCATNNITISDAVKKGFYLLRANPNYK